MGDVFWTFFFTVLVATITDLDSQFMPALFRGQQHLECDWTRLSLTVLLGILFHDQRGILAVPHPNWYLVLHFASLMKCKFNFTPLMK